MPFFGPKLTPQQEEWNRIKAIPDPKRRHMKFTLQQVERKMQQYLPWRHERRNAARANHDLNAWRNMRNHFILAGTATKAFKTIFIPEFDTEGSIVIPYPFLTTPRGMEFYGIGK